jgi:hypothetical protein
VSLAHKSDALTPIGEQKADQIPIAQPTILFDRRQRHRDLSVLKVDAAMNAFMACDRSRLDR